MSVPLTYNGITYQYPNSGNENWGQDATNWAVATTQLLNSLNTIVTNTIASGVFEIADGAAGTPSIRFQNSLTTGIYRASADTLAFSSSGVQAGQISSSGQLQWTSQSAASPSFSFISDPNTGIYNPSADVLGFATNGASVGSVNSAGLWSLSSASIAGSLNVGGSTVLAAASSTQLSLGAYTIDALQTVTLTDNTIGNVFSFAVASNKNFIVDYSIVRSAGKESGQIFISTDGTNVQVSGNCSTVVDCGVSFSGDINSGNVRLRYTTTSTGSDAAMKYVVKRWND